MLFFWIQKTISYFHTCYSNEEQCGHNLVNVPTNDTKLNWIQKNGMRTSCENTTCSFTFSILALLPYSRYWHLADSGQNIGAKSAMFLVLRNSYKDCFQLKCTCPNYGKHLVLYNNSYKCVKIVTHHAALKLTQGESLSFSWGMQTNISDTWCDLQIRSRWSKLIWTGKAQQTIPLWKPW